MTEFKKLEQAGLIGCLTDSGVTSENYKMEKLLRTRLLDLAGLTVTKIKMAADSSYIEFWTDKGMAAFDAYGDCCSESWINHISGLQALLNQKINSVERAEMGGQIERNSPGWSGDRGQEVEQIYSVKFLTGHGVCELEFRNASNGYYGGDLLPAHRLQDCFEITEDF
jgi:hypothetical protein